MTNLISAADSDFESGSPSWGPFPDAPPVALDRTDADAFTGDWSLWVRRTSEDVWGTAAIQLPPLAVEAGKKYQFNGAIRRVSPDDPVAGPSVPSTVLIFFDFLDGSGDLIVGAGTTEVSEPSLSTDWVVLGSDSAGLAAPGAAASCQISVVAFHESPATDRPAFLLDAVVVELGVVAAEVSVTVLGSEFSQPSATSSLVGIGDAETELDSTAATTGLVAGESADADLASTVAEDGIGRGGFAEGDLVSSEAVGGVLHEVDAEADLLAVDALGEVAWQPPATSRDMPVPVIEAALGQPWGTPLDELVWTEIPNCARTIRKREGRSSRLDAVEPGECRLVLDNRDGALDPSNTQSPFWQTNRPGVDYGTWMRISLEVDGAGPAVWFVGSVDRIHPTWHLGDAVVEIDLVDALADLAQLRFRESVLLEELVRHPDIVHLWSTSAAGTLIDDVVGDADGAWSQRVGLGDGLLPFDASSSVAVPAGEDAPPQGVINGVDLSAPWTIMMAVSPGEVTRENGTIHRWQVLSLAGSSGFDFGFGEVFGSTVWPRQALGLFSWVTNPSAPDGYSGTGIGSLVSPGTPLVVSLRWDGTTLRLRARRSDGTLSAASAHTYSFGSTITIRPTTASITPSGWLMPIRIQFVAMLDRSLSDSEIDGLMATAFAPWAGDTTADRFERVCEIAGTGAEVTGSGWPVCSPATIGDENGLVHVTKASNGDGATVTTDLVADGVPWYRQTDPDNIVVWFDTAGQVGAPIRDVDPRYGIDKLAATVQVRRGTGEVHTATDAASPYPPTATLSVDTLLGDPADARDRAATILVDRRVPRYVIDSLDLEGRDARVPTAGLLLRPGDTVGVLAHPPGRAELVQVSSVERLDQMLDYRQRSWQIRYGLDRVATYISWDDIAARHDDWDEVVAAYPTWFDVLSSGTANPPGA